MTDNAEKLSQDSEVSTAKLKDLGAQTLDVMKTRALTAPEANYLTERDRNYHRRRLWEKVIWSIPGWLAALTQLVNVIMSGGA